MHQHAMKAPAQEFLPKYPVYKAAFACVASVALFVPLGIASAQTPPSLGTSSQVLTCKAISPPQTQALVELFTSEGCSSCPPADRWLSALVNLPAQKAMAVGLSLHVDYWDYIGWKDPFAKAAFTQRQYAYARQRGASGVYTPQVVLAGRDFPAWESASGFLQNVKQINERPARARIEAEAHALKNASELIVKLSFTADAPAQLHLVVFENGVKSKVSAGENRGELLSHDRVVREWIRSDVKAGTAATNIAPFPIPKNLKLEQAGLVAFAQSSAGEVLQVVSCDFKP